MSESAIKTKYGNVKINEWGYYQITSRKEGNHNKLLHRLIFEEFYKCNLNEEFPEGVHIHHIDGDKTNNEIWNLEPIPEFEHLSLHMKGKNHYLYGKHHSEETKQKMREKLKGIKRTDEVRRKISKSKNNTGFFRVIKRNTKKYTQGYLWSYVYYQDGKKSQTFISSLDLYKLKQKVVKKGLEWFIIDYEKAKETLKGTSYDLKELA